MHLPCQSVLCATALKAANATRNIWLRMNNILNNQVTHSFKQNPSTFNEMHLNSERKEASCVIERDPGAAGCRLNDCSHQDEPPTHTHTHNRLHMVLHDLPCPARGRGELVQTH